MRVTNAPGLQPVFSIRPVTRGSQDVNVSFTLPTLEQLITFVGNTEGLSTALLFEEQQHPPRPRGIHMIATTPRTTDTDLDQAARRLIAAVQDHPSTLGVVTAGLQAFESHLTREMPRDKTDVVAAATAFQTALVLELFGD